MSIEPERNAYESLVIDDEGLVRLHWPAGVKITGPAARSAFDAVNRLCGATRRPMLVDIATTFTTVILDRVRAIPIPRHVLPK